MARVIFCQNYEENVRFVLTLQLNKMVIYCSSMKISGFYQFLSCLTLFSCSCWSLYQKSSCKTGKFIVNFVSVCSKFFKFVAISFLLILFWTLNFYLFCWSTLNPLVGLSKYLFGWYFSTTFSQKCYFFQSLNWPF